MAGRRFNDGRSARRQAIGPREVAGASGTRTPSERSRAVWLVAIFAVALFGSTAIQLRTLLPTDSRWASWLHAGRPAAGAAAAGAPGSGTVAGMDLRSAPASETEATEAPDQETIVRRADAAARVDEASALASEAQGASSDELRADAVHRLRYADAAHAVPALGQVLGSDASPRVRYEALDSLRVLFASDLDPDGTIRQFIQSAEGDADPRVAAHAREIGTEIQGLSAQAVAD